MTSPDPSKAVLQASAWYPPYQVGGTEVYLEGLNAELGRIGVASRVVMPRPAGAPQRFEHQGVEVDTYPVNAEPSREEMRTGAPHEGFEDFLALLREHPDGIYHQHAWTRGCGLAHLRAAKAMGLRTVLTVHVPNLNCMRGTMMLGGRTACDGLILQRRCAACWAQSRGAPAPVAAALGALPLSLARMSKGGGRLSTALSARALAADRAAEFAAMVTSADRVVAVCQWLHDALALNGVPAEKLSLSRQGVSVGFEAPRAAIAAEPASRLRLLYLGRLSPVKGVDVVVRAILALDPAIPVQLAIHGPAAGSEEMAYKAQIEALATGDPRIVIGGPVPRADLPGLMAQADALVVPSTWLETGPLVVLEARAAGLFVLGSRLGGIAELVDENANGALVEPADPKAWARAIEQLWRRRQLGPLPATGAVRTMAEAAAEMAALYETLH